MNPRDAVEGSSRYGQLELDTTSDYSHIRVRRKENIRTLLFVRDSGEEAVEASLRLDEPWELLVPYTRFMFLSYLFQLKPTKVLFVGLGGGAMVHFLRYHDPEVHIDVVEVDPAIVTIADEHFGLRSEGNVQIVTADGVDYLMQTALHYDVIYVDAFLKPSRETDSTGMPLRLKTPECYRVLKDRLTPDGIVLFNLNAHANIGDDIETIRSSFPQTYMVHMPDPATVVMVASPSHTQEHPSSLMTRAEELDRRFHTSFSFRDMTRHLV